MEEFIHDREEMRLRLCLVYTGSVSTPPCLEKIGVSQVSSNGKTSARGSSSQTGGHMYLI